jgi:hypothetical protein
MVVGRERGKLQDPTVPGKGRANHNGADEILLW